MSYPECRTIGEACRKIDKDIPNGNIGKKIASLENIIRISRFFYENIPTVKVIVRRIVGRFLFFKKTVIVETEFTLQNGNWKQRYPEQIITELHPAEQMAGVLYDRAVAKKMNKTR